MISLLRALDAIWARRAQRYAPQVLDIDKTLTRRAREGIAHHQTRKLS